jgi:23S rRNA (guanine2445-N2)-methyltransferase / 23S rRNA (guanine2069-N7)-methyltransferase
MAKHYGKWARRAGVSCYRVYDADLPDYAVAVDLYQGAGPDDGRRWVHLAEYAAPSHVDERRAAERLAHAAATAADVFEVEPSDVFVKRRERQRGSAQYSRQGNASVTGVVAEGGLQFEVNLSDYLDTGLFLDHRDTRAWLRELAGDRRFLNLFGYTGSASVYAAAGGASATTTVDLSGTYTDWARRNFALNGLASVSNEVVRTDVLEWLETAGEAGRSYDLVFCDPPTFSNSKRMDGTWDVQRDHVALLVAVKRALAPEGLIVFSCNKRRFDLDVEALADAGLAARDVAARTIPRDFERNPGVHACWTMRRA